MTLIQAGHIDADELAQKVFQLDHEPAFIVKCPRVMHEIKARI